MVQPQIAVPIPKGRHVEFADDVVGRSDGVSRAGSAAPLLSVVLCGVGNVDLDALGVAALRRALPVASELLFLDAADGDLAKARNAGLARATGEYVAFLTTADRYASNRIAEILVLSAKSALADVYGGAETLSACVFRRAWIESAGLRFFGRDGGNLFFAMARAMTKKCCFSLRSVVLARGDLVSAADAVPAILRDDLMSVHAAARFAAERDGEAVPAIRRYLLHGNALQFRKLLGTDIPKEVRSTDDAMMRSIVSMVDDDLHSIESRLFLSYAVPLFDGEGKPTAALLDGVLAQKGLFSCVGSTPDEAVLDGAARAFDEDTICDIIIVSGGECDHDEPWLANSSWQVEDALRTCSAVLIRNSHAATVASACGDLGLRPCFFLWKALLRARRILVVKDGGEECLFPVPFLDIDSVEAATAMCRELYESDRFDMAGVFYSLWHAAVVRHGIAAEAAGFLLNRTGYPYFAALLSSESRTNGTLPDLQKWSNLAAGNGFGKPWDASFAKFPMRDWPCETDGMPDISIVMPAFNSEQYLIRSIESVRKQTRFNWELICVDDGSVDGTAGILDFYAAVDGRIRVYRKENSGVSDSRNLGMRQARGRYVAFLDADDWYEPTLVEEVMQKCDLLDLDVCFYDYRCRDYATLKPRYHYWTFSSIGSFWGVCGTVFSSLDLDKWWYYGSLCQMAWKKEFLDNLGAEFPRIPLGEDFALLSRLFPHIKRGFFLSKPLYNYQRGSATSAVTRIGAEKGNAFVQKYETLLTIYRDSLAGSVARCARNKFKGRLLNEIAYDCSVAPIVLDWMRAKGRAGFELDDVDPDCVLVPARVAELSEKLDSATETPKATKDAHGRFVPPREILLMRKIEDLRGRCPKKDLYIVASQLTSDNDEAIDGWSFFLYLKSIGVPARFVVWKRHLRFSEFKKAFPGEIIAISDPFESSYDFLHACKDVLVRAKAVAVEWLIENQAISDWLSKLDGCVYAFLQHGLTYNPPRPVHMKWWTPYNLINFCSEREREMVLSAIGRDRGVRSVVSGMARWDLLEDEREPRDGVVLVMFTWRPTFNISPDQLWSSAYFNGLKSLFSEENVDRLRKSGLRIALSIHHSLRMLDQRKLDFGPHVEIISPLSVSSWIRKASCLITDFSSVSFDFWQMRKPVIYWIPDRFDSSLNPPDQNKVGMACSFLSTFVNQVWSAKEAVDAACRYAQGNFELEAKVLEKIRPFFAERGDYRRRVYEAIEDAAKNGGDSQ